MKTTAATRRRILSVAILACAIVALFVVRLVDVQVVQASALTKQATSDRSVTSTIDGTRGSIVDDSGTVLARTVLRWNVQVSPSVAVQDKDLDRHADEIGRVTGVGGAKVLSIIHQAVAANPKSLYAQIVNGIDATKLDKLTSFHIPWLYFQQVQARVYPDGAVAGNIVGFVGAQGQAQAGMEYEYNSCLSGTNGTQTYQRGADNVPIPGTSKVTKKAKDGGTLVLTLNADLQWFAQQKLAENVKELGGNYGIVTVMNAKTGQLKAVAEYPSVDPNDPGAVPAVDRGSRAFQAPFEPGSVFKAITASALINEGKATPLTHVLAPYHFTSPGGASLYDAVYHQPWPLTLTGVLVQSSNTGISTLGKRLDNKTRYDYMRKFGVGTPPAIDFPGETGGILRPYQTWGAQTKYATMFGQGVSVSAIQIDSIYQTLANGGVQVPASIIEGCRLPDGKMIDVPKEKPVRVVKKSTATQVVHMLQAVVDEGELSSQLKIPGYHIGAKTGTAQQPNGSGGYKSTFVVQVTGVAPIENPQYVVSVVIANPTKIVTSAAAAPLFKTIMTQVLKTYRVPPSTTPSPDYPVYY